ncbi:hypothetical protein H5400_38090 [Rhodococcus wratislaviensis]|nr:hypothetical protein [Rhodococcus sp. 3A]MBC2897746.1 hypothetical protein [Rhodococcus sp. 4CII]
MHRTASLTAVTAIAVVSIAGCASSESSGPPESSSVTAPDVGGPGDIPDTQAFVAAAFPGFTLTVPEGWSSTRSAEGGAFTDKLNSITVDARPATTPPTESSVQQDVDARVSTAPGYTPGSVTTVTRPAGNAVLATYRIDGPVNPVTGKSVTDEVERYTFFREGRLVTITLSAPVGADNVDPWRTVTDSFRWTP